MKTPHARLGAGFEALEDRSLPTIWGVPWPDPEHLTLSFVPDGTQTPFGPSTLFQSLASAGSVDAWENQILRAFENWASQANINVGVVSDGGEPLGAVGAVQGDSRFGDIRIAAAPLSSGLVASSTPFSWTGTTYSGDVVLNSNDPFVIGNVAGSYDVFSVLQHEAGHVFGFPDETTNPNSVMYTTYQYQTGLEAADIAAIQALYGPRVQESSNNSNNSMAQATPLPSAGLGSYLATSDISSPTDVDYYKFNVSLGGALGGVAVRVKASGLSLLVPSVTVYNAWGQVITSATDTDPLSNDLSITFNTGLFGGTYYVKVSASNTVAGFGVGGYELAVNDLSIGEVLAPLTNAVAALASGNVSGALADALPLPPQTSTDSRFDATYRGIVVASTDIDTFEVWTDKYTAGTAVDLNVIAWGLATTPLDPQIHVFNASGTPVAFQVIANSTGLYSVQIQGAIAGADYYVQVVAENPNGPNSTGSYFLGVDFNTAAPQVFAAAGSGTVQPGTGDTATLSVPQAKLFQFALAAQSSGTGGGVTMTVYNATGQVVFTLSATAGQPPETATWYLAAGTYTVQYTDTGSGGNAGPIQYDLFMISLSDSQGPMAPNISSAPPPPPSPPAYTYTSSSSGTPTGYGYTY